LNAVETGLLRCTQGLSTGWLGRRVALGLRRLLSRRDIVDATAEGLKWRMHLHDNVSERKYLFMPKSFDLAERRLLRQYLKNGGVFVDIGANAGIYTVTAAAGDAGCVLAIEPNPVALDRLVFNAAVNGLAHRIRLEPSCVSDAEGPVDLLLDDTNIGGSSLVAPRGQRRLRAQAYPLLAIVQKHGLPRIDALKIDIEGAEDRALMPFFATAPETLHPKLLIVENSVPLWRGDLRGALAQAGYRLHEKAYMNFIFIKGDVPK
jgi:FkbM family methyltransferase